VERAGEDIPRALAYFGALSCTACANPAIAVPASPLEPPSMLDNAAPDPSFIAFLTISPILEGIWLARASGSNWLSKPPSVALCWEVFARQ